MSVSNPRYPHTFAIIRDVNVGTAGMPSFVTTLVHSGECRYYPNGGASYKKDVVVSDFMVSLPSFDFNIQPGDKITCFGEALSDLMARITSSNEGRITDEEYGRLVSISTVRVAYGLVLQSHNGNFGANIWFDSVKN